VHDVGQACSAQPGRINAFYHEASRDRRPQHTLRSHDRQGASRKLSVHTLALCSSCAHHVPHYTAQALRAEAAAYARKPRRTLRSHEYQRASRKLSGNTVALCWPCAHHAPTILPRRYATAASVQSSYLTLSGCQLLSQGETGVRHGIGGGGMHCDDNDAQPGASAAAAGTATTAMHSPAAFYTAGVAATYATLTRLSMRTT
jgi:hypothetical protein